MIWFGWGCTSDPGPCLSLQCWVDVLDVQFAKGKGGALIFTVTGESSPWPVAVKPHVVSPRRFVVTQCFVLKSISFSLPSRNMPSDVSRVSKGKPHQVLAKAPPYSLNSLQPLALRESLRFSLRPGGGDRKMNIHSQRATAEEQTLLRLSRLFSHVYGCVIDTVDRTLPMVHRVLSINKM